MIAAGVLLCRLPAQAATVIVLDPGHGGENLGAEYLAGTEAGVLEKEMTLELAELIREALSERPDIEVYLTREDDRDLSLKERAEYASRAGADLLISLHFNASETHRLYGAEVWIPVQKDYYERTLPAAWQFEQQLVGMGLHCRGIKTRLGQSGQADYYGILRESVKLQVPAILVEHCHVDHMRDLAYWIQEDSLKKLAQADANAILAYLSEGESISLPSCYEHWEESQQLRGQDTTPPEKVSARLAERKESSFVFALQAKETESLVCYYDYSLDHGMTWSELQPWKAGENAGVEAVAAGKESASLEAGDSPYTDSAAEDAETLYTELAIPSGQGTVIFRIYNNYDLCCQTAPIELSESSQDSGEDSGEAWNPAEAGRINGAEKEAGEEGWDPVSQELVERLLPVIRWALAAVLCLMILTAIWTAKVYRK